MMPSERSAVRWTLVLLAVGVTALSSCSSSGGTGTVNGIFETSGGAPDAQHHRLPGNVVVSGSKGDHESEGALGLLVVHLPVVGPQSEGPQPLQ